MPAVQLKAFGPSWLSVSTFFLVFCDLFFYNYCFLSLSPYCNSTSYASERITRSLHTWKSFHSFTNSVYLRKRNPSQSSCHPRQVVTLFCEIPQAKSNWLCVWQKQSDRNSSSICACYRNYKRRKMLPSDSFCLFSVETLFLQILILAHTTQPNRFSNSLCLFQERNTIKIFWNTKHWEWIQTLFNHDNYVHRPEDILT